MEFVVCNRDSIPHINIPHNHIIISVCCPGDTWPDIPKRDATKGILRLAFSDWNEKQKALIKRLAKNPEVAKEAEKCVYFSPGMAKQIVRFVRNNMADVQVIVAHCDAGISRSPGIIAALSKCITGDDAEYFRQYLPNSLVYKLIVKEWHKEVHNGRNRRRNRRSNI